MYYVSSVGDKIGITDTADNVTEYFTSKQVYGILRKGIEVYGAFIYNRDAECTALVPKGIPSKDDLASVLKWVLSHYNNHTVHILEDFLAMCGVGTVIYECYHEDGQYYDSKITKTGEDSWYIDCPSNISHEMTLDSRMASHHVLVYYRSSGELRVGK